MPLTLGFHLGPYEIVAPLGAGAMGEVYRAHDTKLGRDIALKVLPEHLAANPAWLARFRQEAKLLASLNHPNICTIYGLGESSDQLFIAMEYVAGTTLAASIASGALLPATIVRYAIQIADALAHAHARGIIHRDLKSANIMFTNDGRLKILDFGLAIGLNPSFSNLTTIADAVGGPSAIAGTFPYMAPEVLRGGIADARSDLWSFGIVLYEMTTGSVPFTGSTMFDLTSAIMRDPLPQPPPNKRLPLHVVTERCLAKDPGQRYQTAGEALAALESLQSMPLRLPRKTPSQASRRPSRPVSVPDVAVPGPSIAVLPFVNLSPEPDQDYFCEGITEEIINGLTKVPGLHVAARTSAFRFNGERPDIGTIRKRLKVNAVLEGSVRKSGNQLRITANLINTSDGYQLWSERFDRDIRDVFAIQDEISHAIVGTLKVKLSQKRASEFTDVRTSDLAAYNLYLRGRFHVNKRTPDALQKAIENFEQATIIDPKYAPAFAGLADAYCLLTIHAPIPPRSLMPKAKAAAIQAVTLDHDLGAAHSSLGFIHSTYDWDWKRAEQEFLRALELNPGDSNAHHWYAIDCLAPQGRLDEALVEMSHAVKLDPLSRSINTSLGGLYHDRREYQRAIAQYEMTIELEPNFYFSYWNLGRTYEQLRHYDKAMEMFQKALSLSPHNYIAVTQLARCHAQMGNAAEARRLLDELLELRKKIFVPSTAPALIYFSLHDLDHAFELMNAACEERPVWLIWSKVSPVYDDVRGDPRFAALLEKLGL